MRRILDLKCVTIEMWWTHDGDRIVPWLVAFGLLLHYFNASSTHNYNLPPFYNNLLETLRTLKIVTFSL